MARRFRHEEFSAVPRGYRVATITRDGHEIRLAFPPGRRRRGSGRLVSILHPVRENPCELVNPEGYVDVKMPDGSTRRFYTEKTHEFVSRDPETGEERKIEVFEETHREDLPAENPYFSETLKLGSRQVVISANEETGPFTLNKYTNNGETALGRLSARPLKSLRDARARATQWLEAMAERDRNPEYVRRSLYHLLREAARKRGQEFTQESTADGRIAYRYEGNLYTPGELAKKLGVEPVKNPEESPTLFDAIRPGSKVTIVTPHGSRLTGRAVMRGPAGWVLNLGGRYGTPGIATPSNVIRVNPGEFGYAERQARDFIEGMRDGRGGKPSRAHEFEFPEVYREGYREGERRRGSRKNPEEELAEAIDLYTEFHGRDPHEILEIQESAAGRGEFVALGELVELKTDLPSGEAAKFSFKGDEIKLASSPDGRQLYCIGGDQDLGECVRELGLDLSKDVIDLGDARQIVYEAAKWQTNFSDQEWKHDFGEESGMYPRAFYDRLRHRLFFAGGNYRVERPGIID